VLCKDITYMSYQVLNKIILRSQVEKYRNSLVAEGESVSHMTKTSKVFLSS